eukprot:TRINITY_DN23836_c0_g1_i1.p1 TRINITY_DN23836_c0_g1~~TRINITY_DN23836_c0_g1_i1.p1  ORF type:complete len:581 (+),score=136.56 TRINITY_DN23836_c0_g1_i1:173-1915(+)
MTDIYGYLETMRLLPRSVVAGPKKTPNNTPQSHSFSIAITLVTLGLMYSVHNLIAPNMTAMAKVFHFNAYERDAYIGGELTLFFYFPGVFGALFAGVLSGMLERKLLMGVLAILTALSCLMTARVATFHQLAWARAITGFAIGGVLPVVYSLVGDWFPASRRASATAFVTAASGIGVFVGQCIATILGVNDWQLPFIVVALPTIAAGALILHSAVEPARGAQEEGAEAENLYRRTSATHMFNARTLSQFMRNKTNVLVIIQAFPGNIPWGVIIVYLHDFLVQDIGLSMKGALGAITILAGAAFVGVILGGFIGEALYKSSSQHLGLFCGVCNIVRAVPFFLIFGWKEFFGPLDKSSEGLFYTLLVLGGFFATMASPCTGAMLLNVNLPETRGSVMALSSVLDDLAKGFGTLFVSVIVSLVGGRAMAYQISLLLWVGTGLALLHTQKTYIEDEELMRKHLDEAALEAMMLHTKQQAQQAIRSCAKAAGEAHAASRPGGARWCAASGVKPATSWLATEGSSPSPPSGEQQPCGASAGVGPQYGANRNGETRSGIGRSSDERDRLQKAAKAAAAAATVGKRGP